MPSTKDSEQCHLYVVVNLVGGFAREDQATATVVGAFTDSSVAEKVRLACGSSASVTAIVVNEIPAGLRQHLEQLGFALPTLASCK